MLMQDSQDTFLYGTSISEALHRAAARIDGSLDQKLSTVGLTSRQYLLLKNASLHEGINQSRLTELTGIDRSTMTDMVSRLVSRGLLARTKNPLDARAYHVRITESGRQQLALAMPMATQIDDDLLGKIGPAPRQAFLQTLLSICELSDTQTMQASQNRTWPLAS
jgi:MarR family transcriptional regulator, temperature-dependent positive regulator of motility